MVNPSLLVWGRQCVALSDEDAAQKIGVSVERLRQWESGARRPTITQLRKIAAVYRQSFAAFFLPTAPPVFRPPLHDYRRLPSETLTEVPSALLQDIRLALDRRAILMELLLESGNVPEEFTLAANL